MPIQFRCQHCNQLLSISRRKAGSEVYCPRCDSMTLVPDHEEPREAAPAESPVAQAPAARSEQPATSAAAATLEPPPHPGATVPDEFAIAAGDAPPNLWADEGDHEEEAFHIRKPAMTRDDLDMTSLVDICFLLLVFFMITASFTVQKSLQVAAPEPDDASASSAPAIATEDIVGESIVIEVDEQDRIKVEDVAVTGIAQLKEVLLQKRESEQKTDVLIEAAYQATHGTVVEVTDAAIAVGMQKVRRASRSNDD